MQKVFGFYGYSDSGKTTLIEGLTRRFASLGWKVAVVKRSKEATADLPGTDTQRYIQSGAAASVFSGKEETDFFIHSHLDEKEIVSRLQVIDEFDLVFIEGSRDPAIPKIRIGEIQQRENTIFTFAGDLNETFELIYKNFQPKE